MNKTTLEKLKNNQCYCTLKSCDISIKECKGFNCHRWKNCMTKTNKDIDKDMKGNRRDDNGQKIQKGESW